MVAWGNMPQKAHATGRETDGSSRTNGRVKIEANAQEKTSYAEELRGAFYSWMLRRAAIHYGLPKGFPGAIEELARRGEKHRESAATLTRTVRKISDNMKNEQYKLWIKLNKWAIASDAFMLTAGMSMVLVTGAGIIASLALSISAGMTGLALFFNHLAMKNLVERQEGEFQHKLTDMVEKIELDVLRKIKRNPRKYGLVPIGVLFPDPVAAK